MQVESLEVSRRPNYDSEFPNMLVGLVTLKSTQGEQKIRLSNEALSRIFGVIAQEVAETARKNAAAVKSGMSDAMNEPLLAAAARVEQLP